MLNPVKVEQFGGLNVVEDPGEVGWHGAVDIQDVAFEPGLIRQRDGYAKFTTSALTNRPDSMSRYGATYLVVGNGNKINVLDSTGASVANTTAPTASPHFFAEWGDFSANRLYIANGTDTVRYLSGTTFTTPTYTGTTPTGKFLTVTPWDNRLVNARLGGTTLGSNPSTVLFSDAGVPHTFGANNFVDLLPGDGEEITAMVAWRELLFVFKQTKFFVLYGTSTDATGNPIFNYRTVTGTGCTLSASGAVAGHDAVYFHSGRSIYATTGGPPISLADGLRTLLAGEGDKMFTGFSPNALVPTRTNPIMGFSQNRVLFSYGDNATISSGNTRTLAYDLITNQWSRWSIGANCFANAFQTVTSPDNGILHFGYGAGAGGASTKDVGQFSPGLTTDAGAAIPSYYRSGFSDLGSAEIKRIREWRLEGIGSLTLKVSKDYGSLDTGATVTLGSSPALLEARRRYAIRGREFSWYVAPTTGAWTLTNLVANVAETRAVGTHA